MRKVFAYFFQMTHKGPTSRKGDTKNFAAVNLQWENQDPACFLPPTQRIIAEVGPEPSGMKKCYMTEWNRNCGMSYHEWNVRNLMTWDGFVCGARPEDLARIKRSVTHKFCPSAGWMWTDYKGGRAKLERRKGVRPWKVYRVCCCPEGDHQPIPDGWDQNLDHLDHPREVTW